MAKPGKTESMLIDVERRVRAAVPEVDVYKTMDGYGRVFRAHDAHISIFRFPNQKSFVIDGARGVTTPAFPLIRAVLDAAEDLT